MKGLNTKITALIGAVILLFLITALAPDIFGQLASLSASPDVPTWVATVMVVIVGAGLVFLVWKIFS